MNFVYSLGLFFFSFLLISPFHSYPKFTEVNQKSHSVDSQNDLEQILHNINKNPSYYLSSLITWIDRSVKIKALEEDLNELGELLKKINSYKELGGKIILNFKRDFPDARKK
ncbi:hypothetical protein HMI54_009663 [Coelomomyces lativittatus]|nr:hypothetical protein HMI55_007244 [Coelomomyces lativittatus]KAJ1512956.1 hypothetical protein HMI56_003263 [Coelomomyces lativittatus]KAJ1516393.1 hypothetical protein HMI54_009663 [Coelomomyces lativittatus]